eukprot:TRINITY_DN2815_c0_g1_i1.p1 TRINITY_DN2815_c0_g1~~TRINITY_DN2815_c0_g1_i1.p1  ORF type:complete len:359 (-),score=36.22 TRINITY_DN2815_c0_g1_i1:115-1170(-)
MPGPVSGMGQSQKDPRDHHGFCPEICGQCLSISDAAKHGIKAEYEAARTSAAHKWKFLIAGAVAGAASRTTTAPMDRVKVLLQVTPIVNGKTHHLTHGHTHISSVYTGVQSIYRSEGFLAFWRGNGANVVKVVPESACRFFFFETFKELVQGDTQDDLKLWQRFICAASAGFYTQLLIYPLDLIKTRLTASRKAHYRGMAHCLASTIKTEGYRGLYKGLHPSLLGIIPYAGIDLTIYEYLKNTARRRAGTTETATAPYIPFCCGLVSTTVGSAVCYPLQLIRTRLQVQGMSPHVPQQYTGTLHALRTIYTQGGIKALYVGFLPNMIKALPAASITYMVYELMQPVLGIRSL